MTDNIDNDSNTDMNIENTWDGNIYVYNGGKVDPQDINKIRNVIVVDSVTKIKNEAFKECKFLETIHYSSSSSSSLQEIDDFAFYKCTSLRSIEIPPSVWRIGLRAFEGCINLISLTFSSPNLPSSSSSHFLRTMGKEAFRGCKALRSIEFPNTIKTLGDMAFSRCENLTSVMFPKDSPIEEIPLGCFSHCGGLTTVVLSDRVRILSFASFWCCTSLSSIELPNSVEVIDEWAFEDCKSLESIDIPSSVREIGRQTFKLCASLKSFRLEGSIHSIGESTFKGCTSLRSIDISQSIKKIHKDAFAGCPNLTTITTSNPSNQRLETDKASYRRTNEEGAMIELPNNIHYISPKAFEGCHKLDGLVDKQLMVYVCDINKAQPFILQKLHRTPLALRPYILSFPPDKFDEKSWDYGLSEKENKIRHLSHMYYLLVNDDMLWTARQQQEQPERQQQSRKRRKHDDVE